MNSFLILNLDEVQKQLMLNQLIKQNILKTKEDGRKYSVQKWDGAKKMIDKCSTLFEDLLNEKTSHLKKA